MATSTAAASAQDTISSVVRFLLQLRGERQTALIEVLGVSRSGVSERITGLTRWTSADLDALSEYFGVPYATLVTPPPGVINR